MYRYRLQSSITNRPRPQRATGGWVGEWKLTLALSVMVACGFVFAVSRHMEAVQLGYEAEQLKKEIQSLDETGRKLELERQRRLSPSILEVQARRQGMDLPQPAQTVSLQAVDRKEKNQ